MKHTALTRHTPLTRSTPPKRQKRRDPVTSELRLAVFARDGACVLSKLETDHQCRDQWGTPHDPREVNRLSLEHVKSDLRAGLRAPSDLRHLVAMCWSGNVGVPSKESRALIRAYLLEVNA